MKLSEEEYRLIVEFSPNMIWRAGTDAKCDYFNKTWLKFTGRTLAQETGDGWVEGVHADDLERCVKVYQESFRKKRRFEMEYRLRRYDGEYRWINDRGVPLHDAEGGFLGYIGSCIDVTERKEGERLKDQAQKDNLCKIYNRNYLEAYLQHATEKAEKNASKLAVIMLDIDDFKLVNDRYGHIAGDKVLACVAALISKQVRSGDVCGRYGGEEFIVIMENAALEQAKEVAERIRKAVAEECFSACLGQEETVHVTVSGGISCMEGKFAVLELIKSADLGLYQAKKRGKNCIENSEHG